MSAEKMILQLLKSRVFFRYRSLTALYRASYARFGLGLVCLCYSMIPIPID